MLLGLGWIRSARALALTTPLLVAATVGTSGCISKGDTNIGDEGEAGAGTSLEAGAVQSNSELSTTNATAQASADPSSEEPSNSTGDDPESTSDEPTDEPSSEATEHEPSADNTEATEEPETIPAEDGGSGTTDPAKPPALELGGPARITVGLNHSCGLQEDDTALCWGSNSYGQLGNSSVTPSSLPVAVLGATALVEIAAGDNHTCALTADGTVICWGNNGNGQIGDGSYDTSLEPRTVDGLEGAVSIRAGSNHTCALLGDGAVKCWGQGTSGQLGDGNGIESTTPVDVILEGAIALAAGANSSCALLEGGIATCWGDNSYSQLGGDASATQLAPLEVPELKGATSLAISASHACASTKSAVKCWGTATYGELGDGAVSSPTPVQVAGVSNPFSVFVGLYYSCVLTTKGEVKCWGSGDLGRLGNGLLNQSATPVKTALPSAANQLSIGSGTSLHACALLADTTAVCWGAGTSGQIGNGSNLDRAKPYAVAKFGQVTEDPDLVLEFNRDPHLIAVGTNHSCGITDGEVKCWGYNGSGELGRSSTEVAADTWIPLAVTWPGDASAPIEIAVGGAHSCARTDAGLVYCWGANESGQLGNGGNEGQTVPVVVSGLLDVKRIVAGDTHTCALLADGTVWCWGSNGASQLGDTGSSNQSQPVQTQSLPAAVDIAAGGNSSCAVHADGTASCWGENGVGQRGDGTVGAALIPQPVSNLDNVQQIAIGKTSACAVTANRSVKCWGAGDNYQLGTGDPTQLSQPGAQVTGISDAVSVMVGDRYACALLTSGVVKCWGANGNLPQLGAGDATSGITAVAVARIDSAAQLSVSSGTAHHACALLENGNAQCWGDGAYGRLGNGSDSVRKKPLPVLEFGPAPATAGSATPTGTASRFATGTYHSCGIREDQSVWCWGYNGAGQLGNGTSDGLVHGLRSTVDGVANAVEVAVGESHSCALVENGDVYCWGANDMGQLGDGSGNASYAPIQVDGISTAKRISAGRNHSCALLADSTLKCWGYNGFGQLGRGDQANAPTPVRVRGISGVVNVGIGNNTSCAVLADTTARCWGDNDLAQLGDGTAVRGTYAIVPVPVYDFTGGSQVAVGTTHSCAVLTNKTVRCWGWDNYGELGNDSGDNSGIGPVQVTGISNAVEVSAGNRFSCARLSTGAVSCWGNNAEGQVGNETVQTAYLPIATTGVSGAVGLSRGAGTNNHTCALFNDGTAHCWGQGTYGQIGDGSTAARNAAAEVAEFAGAPTFSGGLAATSALRTIATSSSVSCAIRVNKVLCFGGNNAGQPGGADAVPDTSVPTEVPGVSAIEVGTGEYHACSLGSNGKIKCWGDNTYGQLGAGDNAAHTGVVTVAGIDTAIRLAVGTYHNCALLENNSVSCWGSNGRGQLGFGRNSTYEGSGRARVVSDVVAIGAGGDTSCAALNDGGVRCWGANSYGQAGDGSVADSTMPVPVKSLSAKVTQVAPAVQHTCALLSGGTLRCWGDNGYSELGGTPVAPNPTAQVSGISNAASISTGYLYACAMLTTGAARCWGYGSNGEIGDAGAGGTVVAAPSNVSGLSTGATLAANSGRAQHTCAQLGNGDVQCWGLGTSGQLGNGLLSSNVPLSVLFQ